MSIGRGKSISIGRDTGRGGGAKRKSERRNSVPIDEVGESGLKKGGKIDVSVAVVLPHSIYKAREYNKQIFKASASLSSVRIMCSVFIACSHLKIIVDVRVVVHYYQMHCPEITKYDTQINLSAYLLYKSCVV